MSQTERKPSVENAFKIAREFFYRRFPGQYKYRKENDLWGGYFLEWVYRFRTGIPHKYMDFESLEVYKQIITDQEWKHQNE